MSVAPLPWVARTKSADDTRALGAEIATVIRAGDIVVMAGELGTGKTAFVQGFARGLGVTETVTSPTFTLVRPYEGRLRLLHADVYRLDRLQEVIDLALVELLEDRAAVACVEWGDLAAPALPSERLEVRLSFTDADDERLVEVRVVGRSWSVRGATLAQVLDRWLVPPPA